MYGPSPAERIAMARRLIGRNKLTEALDILNEAIRQDPRYPDTYEARAEVFGQMGMYPHAQADRRKAADIRATQTPAAPPPPVPPEAAPEEPPAPQAEAETEAVGEPDAVAEVLEEAGVDEPPPEPPPPPPPEPEPVYQQAPPSTPTYAGPPRPTVSGAILRAAAVVLFALGIFIAAGVGIYLALDAVNGDDDASVAATATPTALDSATEAAGENGDGNGTGDGDGEPQTVDDALRGDPYGFSSVETAFESAGFTVTTGEFSEEVTGFSESAVDMTIEKDGLTMETSILMYDSSAAPGEEWALGTPTTPKGDGVVPVGSSVWYNRNVILVIRVNDDTLRPDALEAFLDIG